MVGYHCGGGEWTGGKQQQQLQQNCTLCCAKVGAVAPSTTRTKKLSLWLLVSPQLIKLFSQNMTAELSAIYGPTFTCTYNLDIELGQCER